MKNAFFLLFLLSNFSQLALADTSGGNGNLLISQTFLDNQVDKLLNHFPKKKKENKKNDIEKQITGSVNSSSPTNQLTTQQTKKNTEQNKEDKKNNSKENVSVKVQQSVSKNLRTNSSKSPQVKQNANKNKKNNNKTNEVIDSNINSSLDSTDAIGITKKAEENKEKDTYQESTELKTEDEKELEKITKERKKDKKEVIDTINFIQPSLGYTEEDISKIDSALTKAEQEQLTILWRATLERNKTIHFIVQKLAPDDQNKKKNQVLSQILNTAIFLPFYALQAVSPTDTSALTSYLGAGLASDLINGKAKKNEDRIQLSQTEMVIMFMMIDQVAERLRNQFHLYKQEKIDELLAQTEMRDSQREAVAALETGSPEGQFLSQVRIRQIERELRRIKLRLRSNRLILIDLCGTEAVNKVDELMNKEIESLLSL